MHDLKTMWIDELNRVAKAAAEKPDLDVSQRIVRATMTAEVESSTDDSRILTFVVRSGGSGDRNRYSTNPDGWEVSEFEKNPVFLWAHDDSRLPLAKGLDVWSEGGKLKLRVEFTPAGLVKFNDIVFEMYKQGYLNAVSAGWVPLEYEWVETEDGWEIAFSKQILVEVSAVPVPADPYALRVAAAAGIDIGPMRQWASRMLEEPRYVLSLPDDITADDSEWMQRAKEQFANFHPSAKLLVLPHGATLETLGEDTPALRDADASEVVVTATPEPDDTEYPAAEPEPAADDTADGIDAEAADDPGTEGGIRATCDWRRRRLSLLSS